MPFTAEQETFKTLLAIELRDRLTLAGLFPSRDMVDKVAANFINALIEYRAEMESNSRNYHSIQGKLTWTEEREKINEKFSSILEQIFAPIGGINPKDRAVFWSGSGVIMAREAGEEIGQTIPGFVLNQLTTSMQEVFFPRAYTKEGHLDTAANLGMWDALSRIYAKGSEADAYVCLIDGETEGTSIFWNTELNTLRQRQAQGLINNIYVLTLTPAALSQYVSLKEQQKLVNGTEDQKITATAAINKQITDLTKNKSNWNKSNLDGYTLKSMSKDQVIKNDVLYVTINPKDPSVFLYTVRAPDGTIQEGLLQTKNFLKPGQELTIENLQRVKERIIKITSVRGHTHNAQLKIKTSEGTVDLDTLKTVGKQFKFFKKPTADFEAQTPKAQSDQALPKCSL